MRLRGLSSFIAISAALLVISRSPESRADVTGEFYDDVKSVIQDLITDEVATKLVPRLVCYGRHPAWSDALNRPRYVVGIDDPKDKSTKYYSLDILKHFPETINAVYSRQYGNLRSSIRREAEDYAAYVVYQSVSDIATSVQFTNQVPSTTPDIEREGRAKAFKTQLLTEKSGSERQRISEIAETDLARGVVETLDTKALKGERDKTAYRFGSDEFTACTTEVEKKLAEDAFAESQTTSLDEICNKPPSGTQTAATLSNHVLACEVALAFRSVLREQPESAKGHLLRGLAAVLTPRIKYLRSIATPLTSTEIPTRVAEIDDIANTLRDILRAESVETEQLKKLAVKLGVIDDKDPNYVEIEAFSRTLLNVWNLANGGDGHIDLATLVEELTSPGRGQNPLETLCKGPTLVSVCEVWSSLHKRLGSVGDYWNVVVSVSRQDYRRVAHQVVALLFDKLTTKDCKSTNSDNQFEADCRASIYRRFSESLVTYFVDPDSSGPSESTRAAFRSAAEDAIRDLALGGGIDRGRTWTHVIIPDLELQALWSKGYIVAGADQFRYAAAVRWISYRPVIRYTQANYLAVHVSLLDLLAPLSEMAERSADFKYTNTSALLFNIISPRFEVVYGAPRLSKHLLVGVGVTGHPFTGNLVGSAPVPTIEYIRFNDGSKDIWRFLDFGVFAKYKI